MAFTVVNTNPGVPLVQRGRPVNLGTITANNNAVQFTVSQLGLPPNGTDAVTVSINPTGALVAATFVLEGSIDGGLSWFSIAPSTTGAGTTNATAIIAAAGAADTAVIFAATYNITGLSGLTLFRFGNTAFTSGSGAVWIACP